MNVLHIYYFILKNDLECDYYDNDEDEDFIAEVRNSLAITIVAIDKYMQFDKCKEIIKSRIINYSAPKRNKTIEDTFSEFEFNIFNTIKRGFPVSPSKATSSDLGDLELSIAIKTQIMIFHKSILPAAEEVVRNLYFHYEELMDDLCR